MKINQILFQFEKWFIIFLFVFIFLLSFVQVVLRYFFNIGFAWIPEIVIFCFISMTLAGASTGVKSGIHIGVDVIVKLFPPTAQALCKVLTGVAGAGLYFFMSYLTYEFVMTFRDMGQVSTITEIPIWIMIVYMPISFFLMGIHYLESLHELYEQFKRGEPISYTLKEHI